MIRGVTLFDNGYRYYPETNIISDKNDQIVVNLSETIEGLSFNPKEMTDTQLWLLCKPIILAHKAGIQQTQNKMTKKFLSLLDLKE
jgi:hypothetical protein